jgi:hypothetical protein
MFDLEILLDDRPGALAEMGRALGNAGVSVEGGGAWVVGGKATAHFLFANGVSARDALQAAGIAVGACRSVVLLRLKQEVVGQLGTVTGRMAEAGVNIQVLYSNHEHQLVLVTDDFEQAASVAAAWEAEKSTCSEPLPDSPLIAAFGCSDSI